MSKDGDLIGRRDPYDQTAIRRSSPEGSVSSVGSSALRWLRGSKSAEPALDQPEDMPKTPVSDPSEPADADDHLELSNPIDGKAPDDGQKNLEAKPPEKSREAQTADKKIQPLFDFDDDDDIGDFDDFGDLDGSLPPSPVEKTSFLSEIDTGLASSPDPLDAKAPPSPGGIIEPIRQASNGEMPNPEPNEAIARPAAKASPAPTIKGDTPRAPLDINLPLRPIPELQQPKTDLPCTRAQSIASKIAEIANEGDGEQTAKVSPKTDQTDDHAPDAEQEDQAGEAINEDWHAHLAGVVEGNNGQKKERPATSASRRQSDGKRAEAPPPPPSPKPSVSSPSAKELELDDDVPIPPLLTKTIRKTTDAGPSPSSLPASVTDLLPQHLSVGIVANVPRLRRFAAARIGDELEADRLVQLTAERALSDPAALQPAHDLGFALITLLCQQRQEMLNDSSTWPRTPEETHAFETSVCRTLAGADQFEIHQFARAMNGLEERDRVLLVSTALENLSYQQIADIIGTPVEHVMMEVAKARMRLRQMLVVDETYHVNGEALSVGAPHTQEIEIHGYLDGELASDHMADIDALVEEDEDAADLLLHYGIQGDLIRRLYAPLLNRPIPAVMLDTLATAAKPSRWGFRFMPRRALRASAFIIALGGLLANVSEFLSAMIQR